MGGQRDVDDAPAISEYGFDESLTNFEGMGPKLLPLTMKPGATVTAEELRVFCRQHLAGYKVPRTYVFQEIPKTSTGKIQKFALREIAKSASAIG